MGAAVGAERLWVLEGGAPLRAIRSFPKASELKRAATRREGAGRGYETNRSGIGRRIAFQQVSGKPPRTGRFFHATPPRKPAATVMNRTRAPGDVREHVSGVRARCGWSDPECGVGRLEGAVDGVHEFAADRVKVDGVA